MRWSRSVSLNTSFNDRAVSWLQALDSPMLLTCSITELGFVRVLAQAPAYGFTLTQARTLLGKMKESELFAFLADDHDVSFLPSWVKAPKQLTGGHLLKLAAANAAVLATLDGRIPGAHLISGR